MFKKYQKNALKLDKFKGCILSLIPPPHHFSPTPEKGKEKKTENFNLILFAKVLWALYKRCWWATFSSVSLASCLANSTVSSLS